MKRKRSKITAEHITEAMNSVTTTRAIPHLPIEILSNISAHLDKPTAVALSQVCRSLRDAGEMKVWEMLDISAYHAFSDDPGEIQP